MWKISIVCLISLLLQACATKEDLAPELASKESVKKTPSQFERLQDSPACKIATPNYITINTLKPLNIDYGIKGDLDLYSISTTALSYYDDWTVSSGDYYGNGRFEVVFGSENTVETGIYITASYGYAGTYEDRNKYISLRLSNFNPWSSSFPKLFVKPNQKVLVMVNANRTSARIKFCKAELEFESGSDNNGTITGEIIVPMEP